MTIAGFLRPAPRQELLVAASAANLAGWHATHLRALGFASEWRDGAWLTPDRVPEIFFHAIAVRPGASASVIGERVTALGWCSVSDPWADLALGSLGYVVGGDHPWMVRDAHGGAQGPTTPPADPVPPELVVEPVQDLAGLADFERVAALGFGSPVRAAFTWHAPPLLLDSRLRLWCGRVDGTTVTVAMSFADAGVLGIYGVTTLPEARRRGYASAITRRTMEAAPALPAVLQPSAMAESMYARMGFRRFTSFRSWDRPG